MPKAKQKRIRLKLGEFNGDKSFVSVEKFREWHAEERQHYTWVQQAAQGDRNLNNLYNNLNSQYQALKQNLQAIAGDDEGNPDENTLENAKRQFEAIYGNNKLVSTASPRGEFIESLREKDDKVAAWALHYFMGLGVSNANYKALEGAFVALQFNKGVASNVDPERESLESLRKEWSEAYTDLSDELGELQNRYAKLVADVETKKAEQTDQFDKLVQDSGSTLDDIATTYDNKLALQSSVSYWTSKASDHKKAACKMGWISLISGALIGAALAYTTYELLLKAAQFEYWRLALLFIFSTLGIWLLRVLVRVYLSHLHLGTDATERITMIQTYLALLREGQGPADDERQLILQTLFRPSSTGLIKDDGVPSSAFELLAKTISKQ